MDDNATLRLTDSDKKRSKSEDIKGMDWPARSPDLNPIEYLRDFLEDAW